MKQTNLITLRISSHYNQLADMIMDTLIHAGAQRVYLTREHNTELKFMYPGDVIKTIYRAGFFTIQYHADTDQICNDTQDALSRFAYDHGLGDHITIEINPHAVWIGTIKPWEPEQ